MLNRRLGYSLSMIVPVVLVWRSRRWKVVRNMRFTGMCPSQRTCEVDTAAGNLHASRMRSGQWRSDCNRSAAEDPNRGNKGRLSGRTTVNRDCLTFSGSR